jgi:hypothetical protein
MRCRENCQCWRFSDSVAVVALRACAGLVPQRCGRLKLYNSITHSQQQAPEALRSMIAAELGFCDGLVLSMFRGVGTVCTHQQL